MSAYITDRKTFKAEEQKDHFRVSIFGSARTKPGEVAYDETFALAKGLAERDMSVVTGGGPGIMEAANKGHEAGEKPDGETHSIGLTIELPFEAEGNEYLDLRKHFYKFSGRLDQFMRLSNAVVVMPGGIGTCLELFYTWQLIQVKHICNIPIICIGEQWETLLKWVKTELAGRGMISPEDMHMVGMASDAEHATQILEKVHADWKERDGDYCLNVQKYS